jgi:hypothetical protein
MAQVPATSATSTADGITNEFTIPFDYLEEDEVFVTVDDVSAAYNWINPGLISLVVPPTAGQVVRRERSTDSNETRHVFQGGVPFLPRYIDENNEQLLFAVQEAVNTADAATAVSDASILLAQEAVDTANAADTKADGAVAASASAVADATEALSIANDAADVANGIAATADAAFAAAASAEAKADEALEAVEAAGVASFNGRAGIVVPELGDYPASLVPYASGTVQEALDNRVATLDTIGTGTAVVVDVSGTELQARTVKGAAGVQVALVGDDVEVSAPDLVTVMDTLLAQMANLELSRQMLHVRDVKAQNTDGGTATAGGWRTRTLNTVVRNTIPSASLSADRISLPAGTYRIKANAPVFRSAEANQLFAPVRLQDITGGVTLLEGPHAGAGGSATFAALTLVPLQGEFVLTVTSLLEVQQYPTQTGTTSGFGRAANISGRSEIYTDVLIERVY